MKYLLLYLLSSTLILKSNPAVFCRRPHYVKHGETCREVRILNFLSEEQFTALNPELDCENLTFGTKICLRDHLLKKTNHSTSGLHKLKHPHHRPELVLGKIELGNVTLTLDLNSEKSFGEAKEVVSNFITGADLGIRAKEIKDDLLEVFQKLRANNKVKKLLTLFSLISVKAFIVLSVISLFLDDKVEEMLKDLKKVMLKEFEKLHLRLDNVIYRMDLHDFRANVGDEIRKGAYLLEKLWTTNSGNNLHSFKEWCKTNPPNDLSQKMIDRISEGSSVLDSLIQATDGNEKIYERVENWMEGLVEWLTILSSSCETLYPVGSENVIKEEFANSLKIILTRLENTREKLLEKWPESVRKIVEEVLEAQPDDKNDKIVVAILGRLKQKFVGCFHVGVGDWYNLAYSQCFKAHLSYFGEYTSEEVDRKIYGIARRSCQKSLPTIVPPTLSNGTVREIATDLHLRYCNSSNTVYAFERARSIFGFWFDSRYRSVSDPDVSVNGVIRERDIEWVVVPA